MIGIHPDFYDSPFSHSDSALHIPYVYVTNEDGQNILNNKLGTNATIEVDVFGSACYPVAGTGDAADVCGVSWSCDDGDFCEFNSVPTETGSGVTFEYSMGNCRPWLVRFDVIPFSFENLHLTAHVHPCSPSDEAGNPDPVACYFDDRQDDLSDTVSTVSTKTVQKVQECAAECGAVLTSENCKFCSDEVSGFEFAMTNEEERCILCPDYDMVYPDRVVPLFGENVKVSIYACALIVHL